jgi:hypothetical protein
MIPRLLPLILVLFQISASAQETPVLHRLCILPVGDPPPFRQEVRDGARYEIPAEEGTIPPRQLEIAASKEEGEPQKLRLRLGVLSEPLEFPMPKSGFMETRQPSGAWVKIPVSTAEATLALVWRSGPNWNKAGVLAVPDGVADRKKGDCRFINVTAKPIGLLWGEERIRLNPGTTLLRSLSTGVQETGLSIYYPSADGSQQPCLSTKVSRKDDKLQQFVIYASDEAKPRMPVKVLPSEEDR